MVPFKICYVTLENFLQIFSSFSFMFLSVFSIPFVGIYLEYSDREESDVFVCLFLLSVLYAGSPHGTLFSFGASLSSIVSCSLYLKKYL